MDWNNLQIEMCSRTLRSKFWTFEEPSNTRYRTRIELALRTDEYRIVALTRSFVSLLCRNRRRGRYRWQCGSTGRWSSPTTSSTSSLAARQASGTQGTDYTVRYDPFAKSRVTLSISLHDLLSEDCQTYPQKYEINILVACPRPLQRTESALDMQGRAFLIQSQIFLI